jgi:cation:H+ antiporter
VTDVFMLLGGFLLLTVGGELLVRGSVSFAESLGISPLIIGLTFVGFGTSMPELVTSVQAARIGAPGIAVGNFVGSNIANTLLVLGLAALITPIAMRKSAVKRDGLFVLAISVAFSLIAYFYTLDRIVGISFLTLLGLYLTYAYRQETAEWDTWKKGHTSFYEKAEAYSHLRDGVHDRTSDEAVAARAAMAKTLIMAIAGIGILIGGGTILVNGAVGLARQFNISESVIGLTIVAIGTSMPEIVTSLVAALRKHSDVALGNILGSNIYNILAIGGTTALIAPTDVPVRIAHFDNLVMVGAAVLLLTFARTGYRVVRLEGLVLLTFYAAYIWSLWPVT